jgi:hypothetical protein
VAANRAYRQRHKLPSFSLNVAKTLIFLATLDGTWVSWGSPNKLASANGWVQLTGTVSGPSANNGTDSMWFFVDKRANGW